MLIAPARTRGTLASLVGRRIGWKEADAVAAVAVAMTANTVSEARRRKVRQSSGTEMVPGGNLGPVVR